MSERTLVLSFDAPLQSWGIGAKGTVKTTAREPSLSGVVGLIANAMGRDRTDSVSDLATLRMGSRTDRRGSTVRDYYTAGTTTGIGIRSETRDEDGKRVFKDSVSKEGIVGTKYYLAGACFTVALAGDAHLIEASAKALASPARVLYLGRRSCPMGASPVLTVLDGDDIEGTLRSTPLRAGMAPEEAWGTQGGQPSAWVTNAGWCADERMLLVLPASPGDPRARLRQDIPVDFSDRHRRYGARHVLFDHMERSTLPQKVTA